MEINQELKEALSQSYPNYKIVQVLPFGDGIGFLSAMNLCTLNDGNCDIKIVSKQAPAEDHELYSFSGPLHAQELRFYNSYAKKTLSKQALCDSIVSNNVLLMKYLEGYEMGNFLKGLNELQVENVIKAICTINQYHWTLPQHESSVPDWIIVKDTTILTSLFAQFVSRLVD